MALKGSNEEKFSHCADLQVVYLVTHFFMKREIANVKNMYEPWRMTRLLFRDLQKNIERSVTKKFEEEACGWAMRVRKKSQYHQKQYHKTGPNQ